MKHALDCLKEIERGLKRKNPLFLLDYDGTLTPIVGDPQKALLSDDMRGVLKRILKSRKIGIISGRALDDVKNLVRVDDIYYSGNHGFEISGPGLEIINPAAEKTKPIILEICAKMQKKLDHVNGALIENKGLTASLHYRMVANEDFPELKEGFEGIVKPYVDEGKVRVTRGRKVFEIRPNIDWDKGKAVLYITDTLHEEDIVPVYIGDDRTDEDAFTALKDKGITILVSPEPKKSNAKYFLRSSDEVKLFLVNILEDIEG